MNKIFNLDEARAALAKLQPHLPMPQLSEHMDSNGISLPNVVANSTVLPMPVQPTVLLAGLGPLVVRTLPVSWKPAFFAYKTRRRRSAQWQRLHATCLNARPADLQDVDGVVAGALLLAVRPLPGLIRAVLMERALTSPAWGAFFAANGIVFANEQDRLINDLATDPRLAAAFYLANPDMGEPLVQLSQSRTDLWSALIALNYDSAGKWLGRLVSHAARSDVAAATALTLQPSAMPEMKETWIARLRQGQPGLACAVTQWTRHTWPTSEWQTLRDRLRAAAVADRGSSWYHWHTTTEPERTVEALQDDNIEILWMAELVHHSRNSGQELRKRMVARLQSKGANPEARLVLRWLHSRARARKLNA